MLSPPRVAVVVVHYRGPDDTVACVRSLQSGSFHDATVVVVDNDAEGPGTEALRAALEPDVRVVASGGNLGFAGGCNAGIRYALTARPEYVWLVNPDTLVERDTLEALVEAADRIPDAGLLAPRILDGRTSPARIWFDGGIVDVAAQRVAHRHAGRLEPDVPAGGPVDVDYATGAALLLRTALIDSIGLLPEDYFLYFEETDYCLRARATGWRVLVVPRARMLHNQRSHGEAPSPVYLYYMSRNRLAFFARWGARPGGPSVDALREWLAPWRAKVAARFPDWVGVFDRIVEEAIADAHAGVLGQRPDIAQIPAADAAAGSSSTSPP